MTPTTILIVAAQLEPAHAGALAIQRHLGFEQLASFGLLGWAIDVEVYWFKWQVFPMSALPLNLTTDELVLRLRQQQFVAAFGLFALAPGPLQRLLDEASRVAAEGLETQLAKVLRSRPQLRDLLIVSGVGWHAGVVGNSSLGAGMDSPAGFALHTGLPTLSNHLGQEQRFRVPALLAEHGVQSAINVIIGQPERDPFGVLEADSTRRHDFVQADKAFLQALANVLAAGIARLESEEAKDGLLREKDLLVREVHHRVANSLQLVRTMLALQGRGVSEDARIELDKAAGRIMSIAAVHRRLYQGGSVLEADVSTYLAALLDDMSGVMDADRSIVLHADPLMLSADALTPIGLVVSELVTNAIKYGAGRILVELRDGADGVEIVVQDEGAGFGIGGIQRSDWGLGMRLLSSLAKGGVIEIDSSVPFARVKIVLKP